jgi:microcystin-dependent protein
MPLKNGRQSSDLQTILVGSVIPPGTIQSFGGKLVPAGWLLCDGSVVPRSTYSALFDAIGVIHGEGNGSTTFHLPDLRGRFLRGADNMGTGAAGRDPDNNSRTAANLGGATPRTKNKSVLFEGFESGSFATNGWTVINGTETNKFIVGTDTKKSGSYSAYISNDGVNNTYTNTSTSIVYFYKDITLGSGQFDFSFYYKQNGETNFDRGRVIIDPTLTVVPSAGVDYTVVPEGGINAPLTNRSITDWTKAYASLDSYANSTVRIIFGWKNDNSFGSQPPIAIDDIDIYSVDSIGTIQGHAFQTHTHIQNSHAHMQISRNNGTNAGSNNGSTDGGTNRDTHNTGSTTAVNQNALAQGGHSQPTPNETRPVNIGLNYIIKV